MASGPSRLQVQQANLQVDRVGPAHYGPYWNCRFQTLQTSLDQKFKRDFHVPLALSRTQISGMGFEIDELGCLRVISILTGKLRKTSLRELPTCSRFTILEV
ncbi:LOW QUALITY PROTEIN: hypothetical protein TorRG33x02_099860 [Trema orientale]|uniref:Uncharacterized protein n=1 Tax=Trema orientale TaxID=63057 RepID=A0A2P5F8Z3_TREOI|nr:LOW QUALITY PROTEIN: hypothetical protein TorRG33x02_099860 [Trema orientale]